MTNLENNPKQSNTPLIPESVYQNLPEFMKQCTSNFTGRERDIFFTALLGVMSASLPGAYGVYAQHRTFPNLYAVILAPPARGKGVLRYARIIGKKIQQERESITHTAPPTLIQELNAPSEYPHYSDTNVTTQGQYNTFFVPGNASNAALMQILKANPESIVIFETEIDSIVSSMKQDWGDIGYILRNSFQYEDVSVARKEFLIQLAEPKISMVLSGTKAQFNKLVPSCEDGLYSRLIIYTFNDQVTWKDVSETPGNRLDVKCEELGSRLLEIHNHLKAYPTKITLSQNQWQKFNQFFTQKVVSNPHPDVDHYVSTILRMGVVTFRIIMILTAIRRAEILETDAQSNSLDVDVETAFLLAGIFLQHSVSQMTDLPMKPNEIKDLKEKFYEALPENRDFASKEAYTLAWEKCMIKERHARNYLSDLAKSGHLEKIKQGLFRKTK